jgi:hypothetical protein
LEHEEDLTSFPNIAWLTQGNNKVALTSLTQIYDLANVDQMTGKLRQQNVEGLQEKYAQDVNHDDDLEWFFSEMRFAILMKDQYYHKFSAPGCIQFIKRTSGKTPDLSCEIENQTVFFEITQLRDEMLKLPRTATLEEATRTSETSSLEVVKAFDSKLQEKADQAASVKAPVVLVVESHRTWNSGFILQHIKPSIETLVQSQPSVSALILLYPPGAIANCQGPIPRPLGVIVVNDNPSYPLNTTVETTLKKISEG